MSSILLTTALSICFVAGKSGGHIIPCLTQAKIIKQQNPQTEIYLFTSGSSLDKKIVENKSEIIPYIPTELENPPYNQWWAWPWFACKTIWYFCKSVYKLHQIHPKELICFGGFVCIPACIAAKILNIPIKLYELNVEPGKAIQFLSRFTDTIYTCFESTASYFPNKKCIMVDYPIRFNDQDKIFDKQRLLDTYKLRPDRKTILILGGSQGSILLNQVIKKLIEQFPDTAEKVQIIHQTGCSDPFNYAQFYQAHQVRHLVFGYHEKLVDFYNLADLIISRAGAGSLFEIKFFNKPCICIPHQTAQTNHQIKNVQALALENPNLFTIIPQDKFTAHALNKALSLQKLK